MDRANYRITRQLDLVKFLQQQRMLVLGALATMNTSQRNFRYDISQMLINDQSALETLDDLSQEAEEPEITLKAIKLMQQSKEPTDWRLLGLADLQTNVENRPKKSFDSTPISSLEVISLSKEESKHEEGKDESEMYESKEGLTVKKKNDLQLITVKTRYTAASHSRTMLP